jgi:putative ABC transport system substrate-binding protein
MRRREFIALIGGTVASWPLTARGQQSERVRRIGVLLGQAIDDQQGQARIAALLKALQDMGWNDGRNVRMDVRWGAGNAQEIIRYASELVATAPDVIVASGSAAVGPLLQATRTVPVVFVVVPDPVGAGFVDSLSQPGGNATGFTIFEYGMGAKWLELLKEISPSIKRVAVLRDAAIAAGAGQFGAIQSVASTLGVELSAVNVRDPGEIERAVSNFARLPDGGLVVTGSSLAAVHRDLIVKLAARHKLPTIYYERFFVGAGGLLSYGPDLVDQHRAAATYVDLILKGKKPTELPVQAPTKYQMAINLTTAKALGLTVSSSLLARADEVIE